jgi:transposase
MNDSNFPPPAAKSASPVRVRKPERRQLRWVPQCLDDLIPPDHPVRIIAAVVAELDLSQFSQPIKAREGVAGRDGTDPELLVALWLYACVRGLGSARELARRCAESLPFLWLCGGVTVNYHLLADFRTACGAALEELLGQLLARLLEQDLVKVSRISQDGMRVRVGAGASSFRREERLQELLATAQAHLQELRAELEHPEQMAGVTARQRGARVRAAREKEQRIAAALAEMPGLKKKKEEAAAKAGQGQAGQKIREREVRASTTDAEARVMKMANGGFNPAVNVQLAVDCTSRAIVGVAVCAEGSDSADLARPMREQVEQRSGGKVEQHLLDGGYMRTQDIEQAHAAGVELFVPPKPARNPEKRGRELEIKPGDTEATRAWKQRMASEPGKEIYKQRAATSETVNADLRIYRGLGHISVRGLEKVKCVVLWSALAYNILHLGARLLSG